MSNTLDINDNSVGGGLTRASVCLIGRSKDGIENNAIEIRTNHDRGIVLPESWFSDMCDWYYKNHKRSANNT